MSGSELLAGRTCIVTGASRGIGKETALGLARLGARVILACRDEVRGLEAREEIARRSGQDDLHLALVDLASQQSIRQFAAKIEREQPPIDVLVNNAATIPRERLVTVDGIETQVAVNHLSSFLMTHLLRSSLVAAAPSRVVTVSSNAHRGARIDFADMQSERKYAATATYRRTKLANILFTRELSRRLEGTGVTANCLHPGVVKTGLLASFFAGPRWLARLGAKMIGVSTERGAANSLHVASAPELQRASGRYFVDCKETTPSAAARDDETARRLWQVSCGLTGLDHEGPTMPRR